MMRDLTERTMGVKRVYEGRALTVDLLDIEQPGGRRSTREIVRHRGAAVVLGQRPDGRFVLIRQHRRAVEQTLLEVVAGCMEPDETPESCACREMAEESGYHVESLDFLGTIVPCPGYSEERLHLYYARVSQEADPLRLDADENLEPAILDGDDIERALDTGALIDGKSVAIWLLWRRRQAQAVLAASAPSPSFPIRG